MKVYVVQRNLDYDGGYIVFASYDKEEAQEFFNLEEVGNYDDITLSEWEGIEGREIDQKSR